MNGGLIMDSISFKFPIIQIVAGAPINSKVSESKYIKIK
jgi:hypothetical protein